jgi:hypothetical protein
MGIFWKEELLEFLGPRGRDFANLFGAITILIYTLIIRNKLK